MNTAVDIRKENGSVEQYDNEPRLDPFLQMVERVLVDPQLPVDRIERVLDLRNEEIQRDRQRAREDAEIAAKRAYFAAMSKCQAELPVVTRNRDNTHTKSTYADLAAIEQQAMPIIHRYGFAVSFQPDGYNDKGELRILWEISHEEGHVRNGVGEIPVDNAGSQGKVNKTGTQAFGSTATYGRRYLLCMLFNISTGDDRDGNRVFGKDITGPISEQQLIDLRAEIERVRADTVKFCTVFEIDALPNLPASEFDEAMQRLREYEQRNKRQARGGQN